MNQEKSILKRSGHWVFDEGVSRIFDSHIRKSLPCYDEIQALIGAISKEVLTDNAFVYDIGTATGEAILSIHKANPDKNISFVGIDNSLEMLKKAKEKCKNVKNVSFHHESAELFDYGPSDLVIAAFTLQFLLPEKREALLQKIRSSLKPNSFLILCEKITFDCEFTNNMIEKLHEKWKLNYYTEAEVLAKKKSLINVMHPVSLEQNIESLKNTGFSSVNTFFQWGNFVCILAR